MLCGTVQTTAIFDASVENQNNNQNIKMKNDS